MIPTPSLVSPEIVLKGSNLHIGQHIVTLHGRKKTRLLLEALMAEGPVKRERLRHEVYTRHSEANEEALSHRLRESQNGSLSKLISRSRRFLTESLAETPFSDDLDWLVYSEKERSWQLVKKRA